MTRWTYLVVQWLKVHLPMQRAQVPSLVWEDATEQLSPRTTTMGPPSRAQELQLLTPAARGRVPQVPKSTQPRSNAPHQQKPLQ